MQVCKILLKYLLRHDKITLGSIIDGRRFALFGGTVTLRLHRNPKGNLGKEGVCYVDYRKSDSGTSIMWYLLQYWIYDRISSWKDTEIAALLH